MCACVSCRFFLVSSVVSHCRCVFAWVACICANDRLLRLSRGGLHRHSFFCFFGACKTSPGQAIAHFFFGGRAGQTRACTCGAVHILDRNVVFSCGASDISSHFVRVRVARCTFWIVTWYFLVVPAAAAFQSFCVCVCMWQCAHFGS